MSLHDRSGDFPVCLQVLLVLFLNLLSLEHNTYSAPLPCGNLRWQVDLKPVAWRIAL